MDGYFALLPCDNAALMDFFGMEIIHNARIPSIERINR